jgi:hypothetical protein
MMHSVDNTVGLSASPPSVRLQTAAQLVVGYCQNSNITLAIDISFSLLWNLVQKSRYTKENRILTHIDVFSLLEIMCRFHFIQPKLY